MGQGLEMAKKRCSMVADGEQDETLTTQVVSKKLFIKLKLKLFINKKRKKAIGVSVEKRINNMGQREEVALLGINSQC